jgi:hypothetical protein
MTFFMRGCAGAAWRVAVQRERVRAALAAAVDARAATTPTSTPTTHEPAKEAMAHA